jgi:DNA gyrase subunit B
MTLVESVRKRPGMFVGDVHDGSGLHYVLWEVVSNAIDQALAGHTSRVEIVLHAAGGATVVDEGSGIDPATLERALLEMHDTATLDGHPWHAHLNGFGGVGLAPVNAVSARFEVETVHAGTLYRWQLSRGVPLGPIESCGPTAARGTRIRFVPDEALFDFIDFDRIAVHTRAAEIAGLIPNLTIIVRDDGCTYTAPRGMLDLLLRRAPSARSFVSADELEEGTRVSMALAWDFWANSREIHSFVNFGRTLGGGTHVAGMLRAIRDLGRTKSAKERLERGLIAFVAVQHRSVQFGAPTRSELISKEVAPIVRRVTAKALADYFAVHPGELRALLSRRG